MFGLGVRHGPKPPRFDFDQLVRQTEVNLNGKALEDEDAILLAAAMESPQAKVVELNLQDNKIGLEGTEALSRAIRIRRIGKLDLWGNSIGDDGAKALADAIWDNDEIFWLDLGYNGIGKRGASALIDSLQNKPHLEYLNFDWNPIGDVGVRAVSHALSKLVKMRTLHLCRVRMTRAGALELAESLKGHGGIIELDIGGNKIGDEGVNAFARILPSLPYLQTLDLHNIDMTQDGAIGLGEGLKGNSSIIELRLGQNNMEDRGIRALSESLPHMSRIQRLNLRSVKMTSDSTPALMQGMQDNSSITTLDIGRNKIGDEGMMSIAKTLPKLEKLEYMDAHNVNMTVQSVESLMEALQVNTSLTTLDINDNRIGDVGVKVIAKTLPHIAKLQKLTLWSVNMTSDGASALIAGLEMNTSIKELEIFDNSEVDASYSRRIEVLLQPDARLGKQEQAVRQGGFDFEQLVKQTEVNLNGKDLVDNDAIRLADALKSSQAKVIELHLQDNKIGLEGAEALAKAIRIRKVRKLYLWGNSIGDEGAKALVEAIRENDFLQWLDLGYNGIGRDGARAVVEAFQQNTPLEYLNLDWNPIGNRGVEAVAKALPIMSRLHTLKLCRVRMTNEGAGVLVEALQRTTSIVELDIGGNRIGNDGVALISKILPRMSALQRLDLHNVNMTHEGARELGEGLRGNPSIEELRIGQNNIVDAGIIAIAKALPHMAKLQRLYLRSVNMTGDSTPALMKGIQGNASITMLDIGRNKVGDDGIVAIADALPYLDKLEYVDLHNVNMTLKSVDALMEGLQVNTSIATLDINDNKIGDAGVKVVAKAFPFLSQLRKLTLWSVNMTSEGALALIEGLQSNASITELEIFDNSLVDASYSRRIDALLQPDVRQDRRELCAKLTRFNFKRLVLQSKLNLSDRAIDDYDIVRLANALSSPKAKVLELDLRNNNIGPEGIEALSKASRIRQIQKLHLRKNAMGDQGANALAVAFEDSDALQWLDCGANGIGPDGATALVNALRSRKSIEHLNLGWNPIGDMGVKAVSSALPQMPKLSTLHLYCVGMMNEGAQALAQGLRGSKKISKLFLYDNKIGDAGICSIADVLPVLLYLEKLYLWNVDMGNEGAKSLLQGLKANASISAIDIDDNDDVDDSLVQQIQDLLAPEARQQRAKFLHQQMQETELTEELRKAEAEKRLLEELAPSRFNYEGLVQQTKVDLSDKQLTDADAIGLARALASPLSRVVELDLRNNNIGPRGAIGLSKTSGILKVKKLHMWKNNIGDPGARALTEVMTGKGSIQWLDLGWNGIGPIGASSIARALRHRPAIEFIGLGNNKIGNAGVKTIAKAMHHLKYLRELSLWNVGMTTDGAVPFIESLKLNTAMTELDIGSNRIGDIACKAIASVLPYLHNLQQLWMSDVGMTAEAANPLVAVLYGNTSITKLDIGKNRIGDDCVKAMAKAVSHMPSLQMLNLHNVNMTHHSARTLAEGLRGHSTITELHVCDNKLEDEGVKAFAEVLPQLPKLEVLSLWNVYMTNFGAQALIEGLLGNSSLREVDIDLNENVDISFYRDMETLLEPETRRERAKALERSDTLGDPASDLHEAFDFKPLVRTTRLDLSGKKLNDDDMARLSEALSSIESKVEELDLRNNEIGPKGADTLAKSSGIRRIRELLLWKNAIGDSGAKAVAKAVALVDVIQRLDIGWNGIGPDGAAAVASSLKYKHIEFLGLSNNRIGDEGVQVLSAATSLMPSLQELSLHRVNMTSEGLQSLATGLNGHVSLKILGLGRNVIGDEGTSSVAGLIGTLPSLEKLDIANTHMKSDGAKVMTEGLQNCPSIRSLNISNNKIGNDGVDAIAKVIPSLPKLEELSICNVSMTAEGVQSLMSSLHTSTNITKLHMDRNKVSDDGVKAIALSIPGMVRLHTLNMHNVNMTVEGAQYLANGMQGNRSIRAFGISGNFVGNDGIIAISDAIAHMPQLEAIHLANVNMTGEGISTLIDALSGSTVMATLGLANNKLGDDGVRAISERLTQLPGLRDLSLYRVGMTDSGAQHLVEGLMVQTSIRSINIGWNHLGEEGVRAVAKAIPRMRYINELNLDGVSMTSEGAQLLVSGVEANTSITMLSLEGGGNDINTLLKSKLEVLLHSRGHLQAMSVGVPTSERMPQETIPAVESERGKLVETRSLAAEPGAGTVEGEREQREEASVSQAQLAEEVQGLSESASSGGSEFLSTSQSGLESSGQHEETEDSSTRGSIELEIARSEVEASSVTQTEFEESTRPFQEDEVIEWTRTSSTQVATRTDTEESEVERSSIHESMEIETSPMVRSTDESETTPNVEQDDASITSGDVAGSESR